MEAILQISESNNNRTVGLILRNKSNKQNKIRTEPNRFPLFNLHFIFILMLSQLTYHIAQNHSLPQLQFIALNLSSSSITTINLIPTKLLFISALNLDNNLLQSLKGIEQFMNIEVLSVNFNFISQKQELLHINNKFLLKELSFLGNPIENHANQEWLKLQGFYNITQLNKVNKIGSLNSDKYLMINQHLISKNSHFNKSFSKTSNEPFMNPMRYLTGVDPENDRLQVKNLSNQTLRSSRFVYATKRQMQGMNIKRLKGFESTGDTRKRRLSSYRMTQNSCLGNQQVCSPNFNQLDEKPFANSDAGYRQSLNQKRVSEFNLYPVDQQMSRSRKVSSFPNRMIYYRQKQRDLSDRIPYQQKPIYRELKKFHPFQETYETNDYIEQDYPQRPYRSDRFHVFSAKRKKNFQIKSQQQEHIQDGNNVIEKQIPIYKQAIAIAFYYRNLIEKVFRGFNIVMNSQIKPKVQFKKQIITQKTSQSLYQQQPPKLNEIELKRYAFMKIELFSNFKKIKQKYSDKKLQIIQKASEDHDIASFI